MPKTEQDAIQFLWTYGHFRNPLFPDGFNIAAEDVPKLSYADQVVREAVASYQSADLNVEHQVAAAHEGRALQIDGEIGPGTLATMDLPRCGHPDYPLDGVAEAQGNGNWKGCHGVGNFHRAIIRVESAPPAHLVSVWPEVRRIVRRMYGEYGLDIAWELPGAYSSRNHQTVYRFVSTAAGWIGLAIIGNNHQCNSSPIWLQQQVRWMASESNPSRKTHGWVILSAHEFGHNCGWGHTRGGIMNPSLMFVAMTWKGDVNEARIRANFGGQPAPGWPDGDSPGPGPEDPESITWNWKQQLEFGDGKSHEYEMQMRGPRMTTPGYGSFRGNWGKGIHNVPMQCLIQPTMAEISEHGT